MQNLVEHNKNWKQLMDVKKREQSVIHHKFPVGATEWKWSCNLQNREH